MKKVRFPYSCLLAVILFGLTSCRSAAPRLDYQALAKASVRLGIDIGPKDNHRLYLQSAEWIGVPYRNGGNSKQGTDCSGLTFQLYKSVYRLSLPRSSDQQREVCHKISRSKLQEGDLVFFSSPASRKKVAHVGIYLKDGRFIHASTRQGVIVSHLDEKYYRQYWICGGRKKG